MGKDQQARWGGKKKKEEEEEARSLKPPICDIKGASKVTGEPHPRITRNRCIEGIPQSVPLTRSLDVNQKAGNLKTGKRGKATSNST